MTQIFSSTLWEHERSDVQTSCKQTNNHCGCILPSENFIMEQGNRCFDLMQVLFFISYIVVTNSLIFIFIYVNCLVSLCLLFGILLERSLFYFHVNLKVWISLPDNQ